MAYGMQDLKLPQSMMEPMPPAFKVQNLNHWATREVPVNIKTVKEIFLLFFFFLTESTKSVVYLIL